MIALFSEFNNYNFLLNGSALIFRIHSALTPINRITYLLTNFKETKIKRPSMVSSFLWYYFGCDMVDVDVCISDFLFSYLCSVSLASLAYQ